MPVVKAFLRRAEEILEIAVAGETDGGDIAILIDRQGGMRMLDSQGWSLPALCAEYSAAAAYIVQRRAQTVRVEGWGGGERCLIQRDLGQRRAFPAFQNFRHAFGDDAQFRGASGTEEAVQTGVACMGVFQSSPGELTLKSRLYVLAGANFSNSVTCERISPVVE
jgi:hypothetical protein